MADDFMLRWRRQHRRGTPSKIRRDSEVRAFVEARLQQTSFQALAEECRERFGRERAPSKSAIHRYWQTTAAYRHRPPQSPENDNEP